MAEDLIEQRRKQQEASQALTQEPVNAYMNFLGSEFAYPRQCTRVVEPTTLDTGPEKDSETGDGAATVEDAAARHALNTWVRNSWRSRTRDRAARSRGGSLRR